MSTAFWSSLIVRCQHTRGSDRTSSAIGENTGQGSWVEIDPADVRAEGLRVDGAAYERPEDLERIGKYLYVAVTEGTRDASGDQKYDGRVLAIDLKSLEVTHFVKPGVNAPVETGDQAGLDNPDNLAHGPNGSLWIVEDNSPSDIWMARGNGAEADGIDLFASLTDVNAEGTGIYFAPQDPKTLFVNVQHSYYEDGDGTWAITKER